MKLLTSALLKDFRKQGDCSEKKDSEIKVITKFFNPCGAGTWYASEYNEETHEFFGFVDLGNKYEAELGYFSLDELEHVKLPYGLKIERDLYFESGKYTLEDAINGKIR